MITDQYSIAICITLLQMYHKNDSSENDCSDICHCGEGEQLVCHVICVEMSPCKTDFAFYNHKAPAYQAHRGPCLCYSGGFICMRPSPGEPLSHN